MAKYIFDALLVVCMAGAIAMFVAWWLIPPHDDAALLLPPPPDFACYWCRHRCGAGAHWVLLRRQKPPDSDEKVAPVGAVALCAACKDKPVPKVSDDDKPKAVSAARAVVQRPFRNRRSRSEIAANWEARQTDAYKRRAAEREKQKEKSNGNDD
ncbi:MAG TPA: hypothetical protein VN541_18665 [Tepidisphaeraceae bacterium]|nr:hypothetical protein [Tepidisphaeraceae bacterium]